MAAEDEQELEHEEGAHATGEPQEAFVDPPDVDVAAARGDRVLIDEDVLGVPGGTSALSQSGPADAALARARSAMKGVAGVDEWLAKWRAGARQAYVRPEAGAELEEYVRREVVGAAAHPAANRELVMSRYTL